MKKNTITLKDFCLMYNIKIKDEEKWYNITNNLLLNKCAISNYGRLRNKTGLIRVPIQDFDTLRYNIQDKNRHYYYVKATDLMCYNIPELYKEDRYLGTPIFKDKNISNCYIDNIIPFWSKAKISEKDKWKEINGFNLIISSEGDIVRKTDKVLLRPTRKNKKESFYVQNKKILNLSLIAQELFNKNIF